mgnify:CR=1 FL=1
MADDPKIGPSTGNRGKGRKKGVPNRTTRVLKDAILQAAELEGADGEGADGLVGYCRSVARKDKKAFSSLLGRVLPVQMQHEGELLHHYNISDRPMTEEEWAEKYASGD